MPAAPSTRRATVRALPFPVPVPAVVLFPLLAALLLFLAGCADQTPPPAPVAPAPTAAAAPAPAGATSPGPAVLANDPSAPINTPLCGAAAQERDAIGQALLPRQYADAGICRTFACYDPATATYIGADGYRHVCR